MKTEFEKLGLLYLPWALALLLKGDPIVSYIVAWLGSFYIFLITFTGAVKKIPQDRTFGAQLMRPLFIMQIIFAGFMACTSIFYFLDGLGYKDFKMTDALRIDDNDHIVLIAKCQRYYCLGHAAFASGILAFMDYTRPKKFSIKDHVLSGLILRIALISFPVSVAFRLIPGLSQFYYQLSSLSFIAGTLALAFAIPLKKAANTAISATLYFFNFYQAFTSGFKEPIIISLLVLAVFLYPNYKKIVISVFVPMILLTFVYLPAYVNNFRASAWSGEADADESSQLALDAALNDDNKDSNWDFLAYRLSEMDMFTTFVESTPKSVDFYGLQLFKQSAIAIIPRAIWPNKPVTEDLVMARVYDAGVINSQSNVSAKPAFIVDAYLTGGPIAIFVLLFAYGAIAQLLSQKAEALFGGYTMGTALVFSGLFQILWRGLSFEFLINSVFWSFFTMLIIHKILVVTHYLKAN